MRTGTTTERPANNRLANQAPTTNAAPPAATDAEPTYSQRFLAKVERQFGAVMGADLGWSAHERMLAQNLYLKVDQVLITSEAARNNQYNDVPFTWANVNIAKLAIDAVPRINLGLNALEKNHIHPVPYLNKKTGKYDIDLMIGYMGDLFIAKKFSIDPIVDITVALVHKTDNFDYSDGDPSSGGIAWVSHKKTNPFDPGDVVGAYGYLSYQNPALNRVILVEYREFEKAQKASKGKNFWGGEFDVWEGSGQNRRKTGTEYDEKYRKEMMYKTAVHRVCAKVILDPAKTSKSLAMIAAGQDEIILAQIEDTQDLNANSQSLSLPERTEVMTVADLLPTEEPEKVPVAAEAGDIRPEF